MAPLAKCLTHTQQRTRAAAVEALGAVVLATDGGVWEATVAHLAQRTFDPHPRVRGALVRVIAALLADFKDRYSYFYQLVPLLLVGLEDEMTDIQEEVATLWEAVGIQWLEENRMSDSRLKEEEDFLTAPPAFYPPHLKRPGLGCRTLVARIQDRIYPSIGNDLKDWTVESRVKAAQLLYRVLWHAEADMVMHLERIITCLLKTRNSWAVTEGVEHSVGAAAPDPWLLNTQTRRKVGSKREGAVTATLLNEHCLAPTRREEVDRAEAEAMYSLALARPAPLHPNPLGLFDLLAALQGDKTVIPSHSVYTINVERIIMRLHHPT